VYRLEWDEVVVDMLAAVLNNERQRYYRGFYSRVGSQEMTFCEEMTKSALLTWRLEIEFV